MDVAHQDTRPAADDAGKLYREIAESIPHMVWTARGDGALDFFNRRCFQYTGLDFARLAGWGWKAVVHPADWERCLATWTRCLQSGERYEVEYRLRRADGAYRWHNGTAVALRDGDGHVARWVGTCTDIQGEIQSARILESMVQERTRALAESEQRFQAFMDNSPAVAWIKNAELRYTYVSRRYEATVGRPAADVIGKDDFELWDRDTAMRRRKDDEEVLAGQRPVQRTRRVADSSGGERHWLIVKFPLLDCMGRTGTAGISIDITSRVQAEELARRYAMEIRTLMNRLVAAQESERRRVADELHDLIGQNLTALGIELGALESRLSDESVGQVAPRLEAMRRLLAATVGSIRGVMTDLRPPALEEYGLLPALRSYAMEFGERTGLKVSVSSPRDVSISREQELVLFRIVQEALTNVAKHSGGTSVEIALREFDGGIRIEVVDDGSGFADPVGARSARRGGWGLPAMRERAEAHGGTLRIEFPARGTRLIVEVPRNNAN
jgi:PAS domain S-box-containing protein